MNSQRIFEQVFLEKTGKAEDKCPDMECLCGYIDHSHPLGEREKIETHLLNCNFCFEQYMFILEQNRNGREETFKTPRWLKEKAIGPRKFSLNSLPSRISDYWSWLSWSGGFASGMIIALIIIMFVPSIYSGNNIPHSDRQPKLLRERVVYSRLFDNNITFPEDSSDMADSSFDDSVIHTDLPSAGYHYQRGEEFLEKSLKAEAMEEFIKAIKYNPDYAEAHWQLARFYEEENNYKEALLHWKRFLYLAPKLGSYKEAKNHIEKLKKNLSE